MTTRRRNDTTDPIAEPTGAKPKHRVRIAALAATLVLLSVAGVLTIKMLTPGSSAGQRIGTLSTRGQGVNTSAGPTGPGAATPSAPAASASATPRPSATARPGNPPPAVPGNRPNASNTGPRYTTTRTLSASQALSELRATKKLSRVKVTGGLTLSGADGKGWVISDSVIEARGSTYAVLAYEGSAGGFTGTLAERPVFQYVEVRGGAVTGSGDTSSLFYGSSTIWRRSELYGGVDIFKIVDRVVVEDSYAYGLHHPSGAHADVIQIREGVDTVIQRNTFSAIVGYGTNPGQSGNAVLQTGSMTGPLRNVKFLNNWVNGGNYILNVGDPGLGYTFAGNRFGRSYRYMPVMGSTDGKSTGTNVWDDTGERVF